VLRNQKAGAVAVARTNLEYTVIRSPIDDTVVARNVDVGQTVAASFKASSIHLRASGRRDNRRFDSSMASSQMEMTITITLLP